VSDDAVLSKTILLFSKRSVTIVLATTCTDLWTNKRTKCVVIRATAIGSNPAWSGDRYGVLAEIGVGTLAVDKVGSSLDETLQVNLITLICKNGVLVSIKSTCIKADLVSVLTKGDGLNSLSICIFNVNIVDLNVVCMDSDRSTWVSTSSRGSILVKLYVYLIGRVAVCVRGVSIDLFNIKKKQGTRMT
jgi:hypothetical protein